MNLQKLSQLAKTNPAAAKAFLNKKGATEVSEAEKELQRKLTAQKGETLTVEELKKLIKSLMPVVRDGKDAQVTPQFIDKVAYNVAQQIAVSADLTKAIVQVFKNEGIKAEDLPGFKELEAKIKKLADNQRHLGKGVAAGYTDQDVIRVANANGGFGGSVSDDAYGAGWDGDTTTAPSKNAVYDKIETLAGGHDAVTVTDTATINHTLTGQDLESEVIDDSITFAKMQEIASNRVLGRSTAGTGDVEALADGAVRDIIGLATTDSPQFAGVNVGHATDTTITRVSAGVIAVEGTNVSLAGHTHTASEVTDFDTEVANNSAVTANTAKLTCDTTNVTAAGALMDSELTDIAAIKAASDANVSTTNTGTSTTAFVTPDALAGSNYGIRYVAIPVTAVGTDVTTGDNKAFIHIPPGMTGWDLVYVHGEVSTAPVGATITVQIHNATDAADMLSTALTIDASETGSDTAATPAVINTAADDVATNDVIRIDVDQVGSSTAGAGLLITLGFRLP